jgi:hypothetical protein
VHDRHQVVGGEAPFDELLRRGLHPRRPAEAGMQIVDDHDIDPAIDALVVLHVGLNRVLLEQRTVRALHRDVDGAEDGDVLRLPVLEHLKVFLLNPRRSLRW